MDFVGTTDTIRVKWTNTNIKLAIDANATWSIPYPLVVTEFFFQNVIL